MKLNNQLTTPELQRIMSIKFRSVSGIDDPFAEEKAISHLHATRLCYEWKHKVISSDHPFNLALRLAIAGNIMDYGANNSFDIHQTLMHVTSSEFTIDHSNLLKKRIYQAKRILYLADNAGEIVFDKLFLEIMGHPDVTVAVRGGKALNDATIQDAEEAGVNSVATIISNGYNAPSTILDQCSKAFLAVYHSVDLIISKGQGNLEGLIHEKDPRIFFLLIVKCDVMAEILNNKKGSIVVLNQTKKGWN